jgi:hypothetical protein
MTGCGTSQTLLGDGSLGQFYVPPNFGLTVSFQNSGDTRYVLADGTSSASLTACANGYCRPVSLAYYYQDAVSVSYSAIEGVPPVQPTLLYTSFGSAHNVTLPRVGAKLWSDLGTNWSVSKAVVLSGQERWASPGPTQGLIAAPGTISPTYFHQYALSLSYSIAGGGSGFGLPVLAFTNQGVLTNSTVSRSATVWADAGTHWTISSKLTNRDPLQQWLAQQSTSGIVAYPQSITVTYQRFMIARIQETGLPFGITWTVTLGGKRYNLTQAGMTLLLTPGLYQYGISTPVIVNSTAVLTPSQPSGTLNLTSTGTTLNAQFSNLIVAMVQANLNSAVVNAIQKGFNVTASKTSTQLSIVISSPDLTGPKVVVLDIANSALGSEFPNLLTVMLDGAQLTKASSVLQLLDVTQPGPLYAVTGTAVGYQVMVYFPHLTRHTLVLSVPVPNPALLPANYLPFAFLFIAILAALANIILTRRRRGAERPVKPKQEKRRWS